MTKEKTKKSKIAESSRESKYVDSLDFRSLWESFSMDTNKNGSQRFKTVWSFITNLTKVGWQRDLLYWMLGPPVDKNHAASPYSKFEQYDWESKREKGFWYAGSNVEQLGKKLSEMHGGMNKLSELGNVNVEFISRLRAIMATVDREFGTLVLPGLSLKRNRERLDLFMMLNRQILDMLKEAQLMYGKMQGVDLQQLTQFIQMMMLKGSNNFSQMLGIESNTTQTVDDPRRGTYDKLLDMVLNKSATYEMPLPDSKMEEILVETRKPKLVQK